MKKRVLPIFLILLLAAFLPVLADGQPSAPVFSLPGGFYDSAISVEITSPEGCEIRYTLDSTDPSTMDTATVYHGPVAVKNTDSEPNTISAIRDITLEWYMPQQDPVPKCTVIRAVCIAPDGSVSDEAVESYFIGRTESYYGKMGTISLVTDASNLFGSANGIFSIGYRFEDWKESDQYVEYEHLSDSRYPTNYNQRGDEWERPASIEVFSDGKSVLSQNIGIRVKGNFTRANAQKSLTFYARKEYGKGKMKYDFFGGKCLDMNGEPITAFDRVCIRSGGNDYAGVRFRDDLNQELMGQTRLDVQAKQPYILYINGEFWGMYSMQEKEDKHYLAAHYGVSKDNVTVIKCGKLEDGSEEMLEQYRELYDWAVEADFSDPDELARLEEAVDLDGLIDLFVGQSYVCNYDFAININNWTMWRVNEPDGSPCGDGKWRFMVYDTEYSLGLYDQFPTQYDYDYLNLMDIDNTDLALPALLFNLVMGNEDFCARFHDRYTELADTVYSAENVLPVIDRLVEQQQDACLDTMTRFGISWNDYYGETAKIRNFFNSRRDYALESLESFCAE